MSKKSEAKARLSLDARPFIDAAKNAADAAGKLGGVMKAAIGSALGNLAAMGAANVLQRLTGTITQNVTEAFKLGDAYAKLAAETGLAADKLVAYKFALEHGITIQEAERLLGEKGEILGRNAKLFRDITIRFTAAGERLKNFWLGVAEKIAPTLLPLLDRLEGLDLADWGRRFAEPIANAIAAITEMATDGDLWKWMGDALSAALRQSGNVIVWLGDLTWNILAQVFTNLATYFRELLSAEIDLAVFRMGMKMAVQTGKLDQATADRYTKNVEAQAFKFKQSIAANLGQGVAEAAKSTQMRDLFNFAPLAARVAKTYQAAAKEGREKAAAAAAKVGTDEDPRRDIRMMRGTFGEGDSLTQVGGGGGISTGLVGVLQETQRQTRILEQIRDLFGMTAPNANAGRPSPFRPMTLDSATGGLSFAH